QNTYLESKHNFGIIVRANNINKDTEKDKNIINIVEAEIAK
ncbi:3446_t:CDS:1, partial [Gigaspora rosea]